ncbi:FtsX-like permease family protein [Streptomyces sp. SID8352]|uniref:FtsX-like permease family protein n=1 Tax=Streptomyces sp. SID8352 TaxID=2690338 RepID=UPI0013698BAB|nr:ABC transporter permease [Streptomyces sp. SID8352]
MSARRPTPLSDARLARHLLRGSDRREWTRLLLTSVGTAAATGFALAAVVLAAVPDGRSVSHFHGLVSESGTRYGVITGLLLSLVPVLAFLGQCARIGAAHRDRRLATLRLAGATPWQVRRIAALETAPACLAGSAVATVFAALLVARSWPAPPVRVWAGMALVAAAVPLLGAAAAALALRRVVASPLGRVRRTRPEEGRRPGWAVLGTLVLLTAAAAWGTGSGRGAPGRLTWLPALTALLAVVALGAGAVWLSGAASRLLGRLAAGRARSAAVLLAAERLRDDPWAAARAQAAVFLVTASSTMFLCVRHSMLGWLDRGEVSAAPPAFYTTGLNLTGAALLVAFAVALSGLAVGTAESLTGRRRALAAQVASGVPRGVLNRALLLETALPLAPAVLLAWGGGLTAGLVYGRITDSPGLPWSALLVAPALYGTCLLASATALPLLGRAVRPGELRYA